MIAGKHPATGWLHIATSYGPNNQVQ